MCCMLPVVITYVAGADPGFEKGGGAGGSGASFGAYLDQIRGLFKEKRVSVRPLRPPPLWIRACVALHTSARCPK